MEEGRVERAREGARRREDFSCMISAIGDEAGFAYELSRHTIHLIYHNHQLRFTIWPVL